MLVHTAGIARIAILIGRVRRLSRSGSRQGARGERQRDKHGANHWEQHPMAAISVVDDTIPKFGIHVSGQLV
jgi:hypothetical protein